MGEQLPLEMLLKRSIVVPLPHFLSPNSITPLLLCCCWMDGWLGVRARACISKIISGLLWGPTGLSVIVPGEIFGREDAGGQLPCLYFLRKPSAVVSIPDSTVRRIQEGRGRAEGYIIQSK